MPRGTHRPPARAATPASGTRENPVVPEEATSAEAPKIKQFTVAQRWAWAADHAFAALLAAGEGFTGVLDPEGRGCCCLFALVSGLWPSVAQNGELYTSLSAMKAHSSTRLVNGVPASERIVSCMIREEIRSRMQVLMATKPEAGEAGHAQYEYLRGAAYNDGCGDVILKVRCTPRTRPLLVPRSF